MCMLREADSLRLLVNRNARALLLFFSAVPNRLACRWLTLRTSACLLIGSVPTKSLTTAQQSFSRTALLDREAIRRPLQSASVSIPSRCMA
jgi:hypothetical protein